MSIAAKVIGTLKGVFGISRESASTVLTPGSASGAVIVRQPGGVAGTDELQIWDDGSNGNILSKNTDGQLIIQGQNSIRLKPGNGNATISIGATGTAFGIGSLHLTWNNNSDGTGQDTGLKRLAATVVGTTDGSSGSGWLQNTAGESRRTATQTVTDSAALTTDNTLTSTLIAGRNYRFRVRYYCTTVNTSGVQVDLNGGTATVSAINGFITIRSAAGAVLNGGQISALNTAVGHTATGTFALVEIEGSMTCTATTGAGTFKPRFAQNAETGAAESVVAQIGSFMELSDVP